MLNFFEVYYKFIIYASTPRISALTHVAETAFQLPSMTKQLSGSFSALNDDLPSDSNSMKSEKMSIPSMQLKDAADEVFQT